MYTNILVAPASLVFESTFWFYRKYPLEMVQSRTSLIAGPSQNHRIHNPWRRGVCSLVPVSATLNLYKM